MAEAAFALAVRLPFIGIPLRHSILPQACPPVRLPLSIYPAADFQRGAKQSGKASTRNPAIPPPVQIRLTRLRKCMQKRFVHLVRICIIRVQLHTLYAFYVPQNVSAGRSSRSFASSVCISRQVCRESIPLLFHPVQA